MPNRRKRRIYLAAPFTRQMEMCRVREQLTKLGFEVVSSWLDEDPTRNGKLTRGEAHHIAEKCAYEINKASILACFIDQGDHSRGGHQIEFAYAWARGKVLISVGSAERNIFHQMWKVRQFDTIEDFLQNVSSWKNYLPPVILS